MAVRVLRERPSWSTFFPSRAYSPSYIISLAFFFFFFLLLGLASVSTARAIGGKGREQGGSRDKQAERAASQITEAGGKFLS